MEALACISGFLYWKKIKASYWKWFPVYLLFVVLSEFAGHYFRFHGMVQANKDFFDYFEIPVEFFFFFWVFYNSFENPKNKRLPIVCAGIYLVCWLTDVLYFSNHVYWFYSFSYTIGNLLLLILILRYFIQLVTSDAILTFKNNMLFWVGTGLLLYYLGTFPYYGLRNTMVNGYHDLFQKYSYIMFILNCLMYLSFSFSFIWGRPNTTSSLS
jgi:hypothetical protein